uniref:Uncharacterized protein n=1 Tax=Chenopodium quinoa TaxID=63459 RepID=A0A803L3W0_CHEQI
MSAISRRLSAGAGTPPPEFRRFSMQFRQPLTTLRLSRNSPTSNDNQYQRPQCIHHQVNVNRWIEVRSDGGEERWKRKKTTSFRCKVGVGEVDEMEERDRTVKVMVAAGATVVLGVANRVLYKLALVPLKHYPFFLAQLATFGYVFVYFSILYLRHRAGFVTKEMLSLPQVPFLGVGLLEALAAVSGMAAATMLSGASIPILSQGGSVDLFVVNSFGSAYQALFICLLLPFLSKLWGIPFNQLPSYLKDGAACFLNINSLSTGCNGAPLLPLLFIIVNMGYNISLLHLLKISSAVVSCLASTVSVPLSVFIFTLPLPYLGAGTALPPGFVAGAVVLVLGLFFYSWRPAMVPASATTS